MVQNPEYYTNLITEIFDEYNITVYNTNKEILFKVQEIKTLLNFDTIKDTEYKQEIINLIDEFTVTNKDYPFITEAGILKVFMLVLSNAFMLSIIDGHHIDDIVDYNLIDKNLLQLIYKITNVYEAKSKAKFKQLELKLQEEKEKTKQMELESQEKTKQMELEIKLLELKIKANLV